jgi:predicted DCC family thiol-disulfide oxidoreductase YuxK
VYFDGGCPLCRREIEHYRAQAGAETLTWIDAACSDPASLGPGLTRDAAISRMHVRRADDSLVSGAAAFAALWSGIPRYVWLGRIASWPAVRTILEAGYVGFLLVRRTWRKP